MYNINNKHQHQRQTGPKEHKHEHHGKPSSKLPHAQHDKKHDHDRDHHHRQHHHRHSPQSQKLPSLDKVFLWYKLVTPVMLEQLRALRPHFDKHQDVVRFYKGLVQQAHAAEIELADEDHLAMMLFSMSSCLTTLHITSHKRYLPSVVCYDEKGIPMIELLDRLTYGDHVRLLKGRLLDAALEKLPALRNTPEVIVKVYYSPRGNDKDNPTSVKTCRHECEVYEDIGSPSPYIPLQAYIWEGERVLVMKPLSPIDERHNPYEIGFQIVEQLWTLFRSGRVHSDIKPENIMVENNLNYRRNKGPVVYFRLIDFEGCSKKKGSKPGRLERRAYTKDFTMQRKKHDIDTSAFWDLRELVGVINFLVGAGKGKRLHKFDHLYKMESPLLKEIESYVLTLPHEHHKVTVKHMERLQELFAKGVPERGGAPYQSKMLQVLLKRQQTRRAAQTAGDRHSAAGPGLAQGAPLPKRPDKQQALPPGTKVANGVVLQDIRRDQKFGHRTRRRHQHERERARDRKNGRDQRGRTNGHGGGHGGGKNK